MNNNQRKPENLLPLPPVAYAILVALIATERHGYDIMKYVEEDLNQDVPTATLYRHIRYLVEDGLIEVDEKRTAASDDPRRRYYKLTSFGQKVCTAETKRTAQMARKAEGLLGGLQPAPQMGGA